MTTKVGTYIREERKKAKITLKELSKSVDISYVYLSMIETGKKPKPSMDVLGKIAEGLSIPLPKMLAVAGFVETKEEEILRERDEDEYESKKNGLIWLHPLELLRLLETKKLAEVFLAHMRKGRSVYHNDLLDALIKGDDGDGGSKEIIDLMIAHHQELFHLDIFRQAIVLYLEPEIPEGVIPETRAKAKNRKTLTAMSDVDSFDFFPLWRKLYFSEDVLTDYGDYRLSSKKVSTFEISPLLGNQTMLLNGRILNPQTLKLIKILLAE